MCYGCCYLFISPPTSRKDLKLLTIKTELDLCMGSRNEEKSQMRGWIRAALIPQMGRVLLEGGRLPSS